MTEAEAHRLAAAEGLVLVLAPGNASGFKGVSRNNGSISPKSGYCAQFCQGGKTVRLGSFSSAAEAALAYARHLGAVTALHVVSREGELGLGLASGSTDGKVQLMSWGSRRHDSRRKSRQDEGPRGRRLSSGGDGERDGCAIA